MPRRWPLYSCLAAVALAQAPGAARAEPDIPPPAAPATPVDEAEPVAPATIRAHQYTLLECLALADRNFPNLWAARARLAYAHGQLTEAKWLPWFQWSAQSAFGLSP